jgi:predicted flap endonuclease-1-like 5' DNA nuclease
MAGIKGIEGIGETYGDKLGALGIRTKAALLETGATRKGRAELAGKSGLSEKLILGWVNRADLFRVKGIGTQYADLLENAGVDTVVELANRKAENLVEKMKAVNAEKKLVRLLPALSKVQDWIAQAKKLPRKVTY